MSMIIEKSQHRIFEQQIRVTKLVMPLRIDCIVRNILLYSKRILNDDTIMNSGYTINSNCIPKYTSYFAINTFHLKILYTP